MHPKRLVDETRYFTPRKRTSKLGCRTVTYQTRTDFQLACVCLDEGNEICAILFFLQACEYHFCSLDVFLRILKIFKECLIPPYYTRIFVCGCVRKSFNRAALTTDQTPQIRTLLSWTSFLIYTVRNNFATFDSNNSIESKDGSRNK